MMLSNASFGWVTGNPTILKSISLTLRISQFIFVIGSVASGKSTLMKALLGEISPLEGSIHSGFPDVVYVS
jgi:ABC-type bacteriocin/lantibiotic exporter with double-glycine peptidase domain